MGGHRPGRACEKRTQPDGVARGLRKKRHDTVERRLPREAGFAPSVRDDDDEIHSHLTEQRRLSER